MFYGLAHAAFHAHTHTQNLGQKKISPEFIKYLSIEQFISKKILQRIFFLFLHNLRKCFFYLLLFFSYTIFDRFESSQF